MTRPTHDEIIRRISSIVADTIGVDELLLLPATRASDVDGWDSIAHVQILIAIEQEFGIRFRTGEMAALANVGELARVIADRLVG